MSSTELDQFRWNIERLADEWQSIADGAARGGYTATLNPSSCAAALRNRLADMSSLPAAECPNCIPKATEPHPRRPGVTRCANCKEWLVCPPASPEVCDVE